MTRTQAFLLTLGLLMIFFGIAGKSLLTGAKGGPEGASLTDTLGPSGSSSGQAGPGAPSPAKGRSPVRRAAAEAARTRSTEVAVGVRLLYADTGLPCVGARADLFRRPTGEGPSFRPSKALSARSGSFADSDGLVRFRAPFGTDLEVIASVQDGSTRERLVLGVLNSAPDQPFEFRLRRPPSPLKVKVIDDVQRPIPGVSIRIVAEGTRPGAEYSSSGVLGSRTDGDGRSTLSGKARAARWLLLDAPGYSPKAISIERLAPDEHIEAKLPAETSLELDIVDDAGRALVGAVIEIEFSLSGFTTARISKTDRRGHVSIRHLPADTPLRPVVTPKGGLPQTVEALESSPGEPLSATLHVIQ